MITKQSKKKSICNQQAFVCPFASSKRTVVWYDAELCCAELCCAGMGWVSRLGESFGPFHVVEPVLI